MYNISLNENGLTFKELEKRIYRATCDQSCEVMKQILESLDEPTECTFSTLPISH